VLDMIELEAAQALRDAIRRSNILAPAQPSTRGAAGGQEAARPPSR
jgi:hypothetical protein